MADTSVQRDIAEWIRTTWLQETYHQTFQKSSVKLSLGGAHEFSAVSSDNNIVACISTSELKSPSNNKGAGKVKNIWADLYFLIHVEVNERMVLFTEQDMFAHFEQEAARGKVPKTIRFYHVPITDEHLCDQLKASRTRASKEVAPSK